MRLTRNCGCKDLQTDVKNSKVKNSKVKIAKNKVFYWGVKLL